MKKFYFLLIALLCSVTMAFAYDAYIDGIYYYFDHENKTAEVTGYHNNGNYNCYSGNVVIPEYVSYNGEKYIIISIDSYAFHKCENLISITIPNSVTSIGGNAFSDCISLTSVEIPSEVTEIGPRAFSNCVGLTSVVFSNGVTKIGYEAFSGCISLLPCIIPSSVRIIEDGVFIHCSSITSIIIPNSVIEIGNYVFRGCTRLSQINVNEDNQNYASIDGVLYDKNITKLICCPAGTNLTSILIPNSVTEIGDEAFSGCIGLMAIEVEKDNQTYASFDGALYDKNLTTLIYCPEGKTSIEIPNSVTSIEIREGGDFSYNSNLTSINVAENHEIYASVDGVLYDKNITTLMCCPQGKVLVTIPNSVTSIGDYAFSSCSSLVSITIPESVTSIGDGAFEDCLGFTSIEIPHSVTEIGSGAFYGCVGFTSVIIGNGVTLIDDEVFRECVELTSVIIGSGVTSIGSCTFGECVGLTSIEIEAQNPPVIDDDTFEEVSRSIQIKVPCGSKAKYQIAEYWKEFVNYEEVPGATLIVDVNDKTMGFATITKPNSCTDDVAQVQAQALAGYEFVRWSDGATENPHILLVTEDITITAEFRKIGEEPEDKPGEKPGEDETHNNFIVESADKTQGNVKITITAEAIEGFEFDHWSDGSTENPRVVTLDADVELYAYFRVAGTGLENNVISSANIYTTAGTLHVEGAETAYHILDASGRLIYSGNATSLSLPRGVYIITIAGEMQKVVL